ncbi:MAG: type II secretion system protein [Helicobacteraceae bacterium]|nr:type II secretion system protein [Helicobacteraceae bacterium]
MKNFKSGFTMIELVFVIVVLGILAAVAIPRFAATRVDAQISKGAADVASIRSAIVSERQSRLIAGDTAWITKADLDDGDELFEGVLMYPQANVANKDGAWSRTDAEGSGTYVYRAGGVPTIFTYDDNDGTFTCTAGTGYCDQLQ